MMMRESMPTLDPKGAEREGIGLLATHHDGKEPFSERFRRAKLRAEMFGDAGESLTIGRYTVTRKIGEGAMGAVFRATDSTLDRDVAVKVLHGRDATHRARMQIEAKALAKLSHPNVVTVHEVATEDEQLFVAMEYVRGRTLTKWLEGTPDGQTLVDVFVQAARGLQAAHDAGVVHRDFKPDNVLVGDDGRVRVVDFGMARTPGATLVDEVEEGEGQLDAREPTLTRTGVLAGTPGYMSPEQFEGGRVDARADQFAFCIALHEAVWGVRPFEGETLGELAAAVVAGRASMFETEARADLGAHVISIVRAVVERGLAPAPEDRFASMSALIDELSTATVKPTGRELAIPAWSFSPLKNRAVAVSSVAVALASSAFVLFGLRGEPEAPKPQAVAAAKADGQPSAAGAAGAPKESAQATGTSRVVYVEEGPDKRVERRRRESRRRTTRNSESFDPSVVECAEEVCSIPRSVFLLGGDGPVTIDLQARFVPALEDGKSIGVKMYGVREGSILDALGFEVGDLVTRLNDLDLGGQGVEEVIGAVGSLKTVDEIAIAFRRGGEPRQLTVRLVD